MPLSGLLLPHPAWRACDFFTATTIKAYDQKRAISKQKTESFPSFPSLPSSLLFPFPFFLLYPQLTTNNDFLFTNKHQRINFLNTKTPPHSPKCTAPIVPSAAPPSPAAPRPAAPAVLYVLPALYGYWPLFLHVTNTLYLLQSCPV